jgi:hypothetical protein
MSCPLLLWTAPFSAAAYELRPALVDCALLGCLLWTARFAATQLSLGDLDAKEFSELFYFCVDAEIKEFTELLDAKHHCLHSDIAG